MIAHLLNALEYILSVHTDAVEIISTRGSRWTVLAFKPVASLAICFGPQQNSGELPIVLHLEADRRRRVPLTADLSCP